MGIELGLLVAGCEASKTTTEDEENTIHVNRQENVYGLIDCIVFLDNLQEVFTTITTHTLQEILQAGF